MGTDKYLFYTLEALDVLKREMNPRKHTLHKMMNPLCPTCAYEHGLSILRGKKVDDADPE